MTRLAGKYRPAALVVVFAMSLLPAAQAHTPAPGTPSPYTNAKSSSFGEIEMTPYARSEGGEPVSVASQVIIRSSGALKDAARIMFAFNLHTRTAHVELLRLETADGRPVPLSRDDRGLDPLQPRVFVEPGNLTVGQELVLRGRAWADNNGQFHVGALVIAFDDEWATVTTPEGDSAELYAFAMVGVIGTSGGFLAAPFEGQGNPAWLTGSLILVGVACAGGFAFQVARRRRKGRPVVPGPSANPPANAPRGPAPRSPVLGPKSPPPLAPGRQVTGPAASVVRRAGPVKAFGNALRAAPTRIVKFARSAKVRTRAPSPSLRPGTPGPDVRRTDPQPPPSRPVRK